MRISDWSSDVCSSDLADLQDPPELLSALLDKMAEGYDVVYGQRVSRAGETLFKRASANLFYRILQRMVDVPIPPDTGDFRIMSRRVVAHLNAMPERFRFIRGMVGWVGFSQSSEEHTSELQSLMRISYAVFCLKKKTKL